MFLQHIDFSSLLFFLSLILQISTRFQAHVYSSEEALTVSGDQCCETEVIGAAQSCCNGVGYSSALQTCADVGGGRSGCGTGTICPLGGSHTRAKTEWNVFSLQHIIVAVLHVGICLIEL